MKIPASETHSCCRRGHENCVFQGLVSALGSRLRGAGQANISLQMSQACDNLGRMREGGKARKSSDIADWVSQPCSRAIVRDSNWLSCASLTRWPAKPQGRRSFQGHGPHVLLAGPAAAVAPGLQRGLQVHQSVGNRRCGRSSLGFPGDSAIVGPVKGCLSPDCSGSGWEQREALQSAL